MALAIGDKKDRPRFSYFQFSNETTFYQSIKQQSTCVLLNNDALGTHDVQDVPVYLRAESPSYLS